MNELQYAIGLDIGTSGVKAVLGSSDGESVSVIACQEAPYDDHYDAISKGVITNSNNTFKTANEVLQILLEGYEDESEFVVNVNFCQEGINIEESKATYDEKGTKFDITQQVLQELYIINRNKYQPTESEEEDYDTLHSMPTDFYVDGVLKDRSPGGNHGNNLSCGFLNVNVPSDRFNTFRNELQKIRIDPKNKHPYLSVESVIYAPIADAISVLTDDDKREGVILINVGDTFSTATYFKKNAPRKFTQLPFGSNLIAEDISKKMDISLGEAKKLQVACMGRRSSQIEINEILTLVQHNGLPSKRFLEKNIVQVAEWRLREIAALLNCQLDLEEQPKNGIILTGGIAKLPSLKSVIRKEFNIDIVRVANATQNFLGITPNEVSDPRFSVATGLLLSSFVPLDKRMVGLKLNQMVKKTKSGDGWTVAKRIKNMFVNDDLNQGYGE